VISRKTRMAVLLSSLAAAACSDSRHIREWRPSDHDQSDEENQVAADPGNGQAASGDVATDVVFRQNCAGCHGTDGSAQTPMAAQMRIKDLRASTLSEDDLVKVISRGRARMPAFGESLDPEAIRALARKVMRFR
jgi:mono/diheme cytochrome c family protein